MGSHIEHGRVAGKIAIVTGSSNGIGREISLLLAKEGAIVVCADLSPNSREAKDAPTHEAIKKTGGNSIFQKVDVTSDTEVAAAVDAAFAEFGRLDIMVNNAGVAYGGGGRPQPIWDCDEKMFDATLSVNTKGVFLGCKHASRIMKDQTPGPTGARGWIVNTASILGLIALPQTIHYTTSKHACVGITRVAAVDCAPYKIHVNAICPGFISTDMTKIHRDDPTTFARLSALHPFGGFGEPEDIARAVLFLASPENTYMTGEYPAFAASCVRTFVPKTFSLCCQLQYTIPLLQHHTGRSG